MGIDLSGHQFGVSQQFLIAPGDMYQQIPHEMHSVTLSPRRHHCGDRGLEAFVFVGDDQPDWFQTAVRQRSEELGPTLPGFAGDDIQPNTSRRPSELTPKAIKTATDRTCPSRRTFKLVVSSQ